MNGQMQGQGIGMQGATFTRNGCLRKISYSSGMGNNGQWHKYTLELDVGTQYPLKISTFDTNDGQAAQGMLNMMIDVSFTEKPGTSPAGNPVIYRNMIKGGIRLSTMQPPPQQIQQQLPPQMPMPQPQQMPMQAPTPMQQPNATYIDGQAFGMACNQAQRVLSASKRKMEDLVDDDWVLYKKLTKQFFKTNEETKRELQNPNAPEEPTIEEEDVK